MDALKGVMEPSRHAKLVGFMDGCLVAPVAKLWTSPPRQIATWSDEANGYPLPSAASSGSVVFAGSFNPPHIGHAEIIRFLSRSFNQVHVVIGMNPKKTYPVSPDTRKEILESFLPAVDASNVKVWVWGDVIFKLAKQVGATAMYRGIRTWEEDGKPERYLEVQNLCWPMLSSCGTPTYTYYVEGAPHYRFISSTELRRRLKEGESIDDIVPACAAAKVREAYHDKL
eukprot:TRINITY_DN79139_c0_g1_i1.p1 TRINITY_DN79139_c0_g1~~TRINITY_DN79139_c0_g1_i1.p1  ORF type:complete len:227 (+),score=36.45 TRINITY_DN79139_c0_g1_i1:54-734(+)